MAAVDVNFRTKLAAILPTGTTIQEGKIDELADKTRVWFRRASQKNERMLNGDPGWTTTEFDVEIHSQDDGEAQSLADTIQTLDGTFGAMGDMTVEAIFVDDQDETYIPKAMLSTDDGVFMSALKVKVIFNA